MNDEKINKGEYKIRDIIWGFILYGLFEFVFIVFFFNFPKILMPSLILLLLISMYVVGIIYFAKKNRTDAIIGIGIAFATFPFIFYIASLLGLIQHTLFEL
jgi:hypothetical protein